ncbi:Transglutaminase 1 [Mactra antiquata]
MDFVPFRGLDPVLTSRFPAFSRHSDRWSFHGSLPRSLTIPRSNSVYDNLIEPSFMAINNETRPDDGPSRLTRDDPPNLHRRRPETRHSYHRTSFKPSVTLHSNTLPRNVTNRSPTGSRYTENILGNRRNNRGRTISPVRRPNDDFNHLNDSFTLGRSSRLRHRRNRSLSPRRPRDGIRIAPRSDYGIASVSLTADSGRSGMRASPRTNIITDINYYTYSDDDTDSSEHRVKPAGPSISNDIKAIKIKGVDFMVMENARAHHTDKFARSHDSGLIVRRGQRFYMSIVLDQKISLTGHEIVFLFTTGTNPQPGKGTYIFLSSTTKLHADNWTIQIDKVFHDRVTFVIQSPSDTIIGEWKVSIGVKMDDSPDDMIVKPKGSMIILFNPWDKDDDVFFPEVTKLSEYVLNDSGCIFTGSEGQIGLKPWFYGQFEGDILTAALHCIDKAFNFRSGRAKGNPVRVARAISKIVNSNDDNGVIMGNWSGNYSNQTPPLSWAGSVKILRQFLKTSKPVKYGQCFVFAGVVTTICRALGIPCRNVTNFSSAHDTDGNVTVDVHWDSGHDEPITESNTDSIWNFHVWNDVWMKRKDLPVGNDGWQVLDATPQETSDGEFRCGPAPLSAILNGRCDVMYDAPFIYAEVNADRVHWSKSSNGGWEVIGIDKQVVGKSISTKIADGKPIPGNVTDCERYREDITHLYKYPEGGDRERISMLTACSSLSSGASNNYTKCKDVKLDIQTPKQVFVGSGFDILIVCSNLTGVQQTISGRFICDVTRYTGSVVSVLRKDSFEEVIEAYEQKQIVIHVEADDYIDYVIEAAMFKISMIGKIKDSNQQFAKLCNFRLLLPDLVVKARSNFPRCGQAISLDVSFTNPLMKRSLTNCILQTEYTGMKDDRSRSIWNILPGEKLQTTIDVIPEVKGACAVFVTFCCDNLPDLQGTCELYIQ